MESDEYELQLSDESSIFQIKVELSGQSVIVTEDEAAQLTTVDKVIEMLGAKRSAVFFKTSLKRDGFTTNSSTVSRKKLYREHMIFN